MALNGIGGIKLSKKFAIQRMEFLYEYFSKEFDRTFKKPITMNKLMKREYLMGFLDALNDGEYILKNQSTYKKHSVTKKYPFKWSQTR